MKYMIIDVGSNTVKYDVYDVKKQTCRETAHESRALRLIGYIDQGVLSQAGLDALCRTLLDYKNTAKDLSCKRVCCFATASLRRVRDPAPVLEEVYARTGIAVDLLSGEEEAARSFEGMLLTLPERPACGVMLDMGGGSTELNFFENDRTVYLCSCQFGALSLKNDFDVGRTMTPDCAETMRDRVSSVLPERAKDYVGRTDAAILVGGTAKACAKLMRALLDKSGEEVSAGDFEELLHILSAPDDEQYEMIKTLCPDRYALMSSGCTAFDEIFKRLGCRRIYFCRGGIREGYLQKICGKALQSKEK